MRFRPLNYQALQPPPPKRSLTTTFSKLLSGILPLKGKISSKNLPESDKNINCNKSAILNRSDIDGSFTDKNNMSAINRSRNSSISNLSMISKDEDLNNILVESEEDKKICFL